MQGSSPKTMKERFDELDGRIVGFVNERPSRVWIAAFVGGLILLGFGVIGAARTLGEGLGLWGLNNSLSWGFSIANFVFWIGLGHAGTLISAILLIFRQDWRASINRAAEAMTIISLICAAFFPLIHAGRPWFAAFRLIPFPNQLGLAPNYNSPLVWDVFAIGIYFSVSVLFWYFGMIPDLASLKSRVKSKFVRKLYDFFSLGYAGSLREQSNYRGTYVIMAGIAFALVVSVHTIVSFDFSVGLVEAWHSTMFPPYFVAGAILSGCAAANLLLLLIRKAYRLSDLISDRVFDNLNKIILVTSLIVCAAYIFDFIMPKLYLGHNYEPIFKKEAFEKYFWLICILLTSVVVAPQLFWIGKVRLNTTFTGIISALVLAGMWLERYLIVVPALEFGFLPVAHSDYLPSLTEISVFVGSLGLFLVLFLLFIKFVPVVSTTDVKKQL